MTIEEKSRDFAGYGIISSRDTITTVNMSGKYDGFKAGANWMLEKALGWIGDSVVFDKFGRPIDTEEFRKLMEK